MPEGPEIRRAADRLERAIVPLVVTGVYFAFDPLKPFEQLLAGQRVTAVETRGKAMLTRFSNELTLYTHNQLYGRWVIRAAHSYPATNRQLRLAIHNERRSALLYSASEIAVLTPQQLADHPFLSRLGPDVLSVTPARVIAQLRAPRCARRRLGSLLLDQHLVAGIGNYLRSEILFVARLHPALRPIDCNDAEIGRLAGAAVAVARQAYRHNGVTTALAHARLLKSQGQARAQYRHWVFDRAGCACRQCGTAIVGDTAAGRRIFHCPACQAARTA